ncbi:hypothetical protein [Caproiciproducens sp. CPB-2]|uniref:hypothetical protein n=1 Tax=Caproiciproducens sp. CPB-2 TaxID=3030017 RepID=UPI0023D9D631|nr:hypothetical protein [Caproiciproducens sp. CPB-2]MDF1494562.1 hypothetical protein [Caproiciproducens sp. CPB-2]
MLILGINRILNWLQITTGGRSYTCPTKEINGNLFFKFKNEWHRATDYVSEHTMELISEGGENISRRFKK